MNDTIISNPLLTFCIPSGTSKMAFLAMGSARCRTSGISKAVEHCRTLNILSLSLLFSRRNFDAPFPSGPRNLAPLLLRLARVRLNVGSGPAGLGHPAYCIIAVALRSSPFRLSSFNEGPKRGSTGFPWNGQGQRDTGELTLEDLLPTT
jgi:hypothetical protein